jgi:hypothetical protein
MPGGFECAGPINSLFPKLVIANTNDSALRTLAVRCGDVQRRENSSASQRGCNLISKGAIMQATHPSWSCRKPARMLTPEQDEVKAI